MIETSQYIVSCYPVNHMWLDLTWWRNSRSVGLRSDNEDHWSKEASKEFKILFSALVLFTRPHEKPWKRKHSSNCFVSQHSFTWGWDQKSIYFDLHWFCNEKQNQIFYMLWQYKLDKNFNLTFDENRSLLSSMAAKICFKMLMKSSVVHFLSLELTNFKVGCILQPFF